MRRITIAGIATAAALTVGGGIYAGTALADNGDHSGRDRQAEATSHHGSRTPAATRISADQARAIALRAEPGAKITATELDDDDDHGGLAWEVELDPTTGPHRELKINPQTGGITQNQPDNDSDD